MDVPLSRPEYFHVASPDPKMLLPPIRSAPCRRHISVRVIGRQSAFFHGSRHSRRNVPSDPRLDNIGPIIRDEFALLRPSYRVPQHPIVLAHGLLGFDELRVAGPSFPRIEYWYGIKQALAGRGVEVMTASVPPSASIETRAATLAESIERMAKGKAVNIIA